MTREEIYNICLKRLEHNKCLLLELPTGIGKSKMAIDLSKHLCTSVFSGRRIRLLLLVDKKVHKKTWKEEFEKWGAIQNADIVTECYASLHKYIGQYFDIILMDECHHIGSEKRMETFKHLKYSYIIGLSATIPKAVKNFFGYNFHASIVSCSLDAAIKNKILPKPQVLLWPLTLDDTYLTESLLVNPHAKGKMIQGDYSKIWYYRKNKIKAKILCTPFQKNKELTSDIIYAKKIFFSCKEDTKKAVYKNRWLLLCNKRLEWFSTLRLPLIQKILARLRDERTITFCKNIEQTNLLGKWCIHSQNNKANQYYEDFNKKKIHHITAVNMLNENANLVDCKYAIFGNLPSSDLVQVQRTGRALRHPHPVIIIPYYKDTREEEIINKMIENMDKNYVKEIHSINEI